MNGHVQLLELEQRFLDKFSGRKIHFHQMKRLGFKIIFAVNMAGIFYFGFNFEMMANMGPDLFLGYTAVCDFIILAVLGVKWRKDRKGQVLSLAFFSLFLSFVYRQL